MQNPEPPVNKIKNLYGVLKDTHLRDMLNDEARNKSLTCEHDGILLDYTHEKINEEMLGLFEELTQSAGLYQRIEDMFNGVIILFFKTGKNKINITENRSVLHVALRSDPNEVIKVDGKNVVPEVHATLQRVQKFSDSVRSGEIKGYTGKNLRNVVVIGIGGSYLSIEFVYEALRSHSVAQQTANGRVLRFLANVDPIDFQRAVQHLNVEETLFVINSKTFTTAETMMNARCCRQWIIDEYAKVGKNDEKGEVLSHMCAVSTNLSETSKFGIVDERVIPFWDWVGGRFSVCSAIGMLPLSLHFGFAYMLSFLRGANDIDQHFLKTKNVRQNLPLLFGLIYWYRCSIQGSQTVALLPYSQSLVRFAAHIQQLSMESNGKQSLLCPEKANDFLAPHDAVIFGEPGTNSQHSFYQMLHQGKFIIPCEFIGYSKSQAEDNCTGERQNKIRDQHDELMSNFFAQVDALARGKTYDEVKAEGVKEELIQHKVFPGDRSSIQLLFRGETNPYNLGQLLALYEHRVAVAGFLWNINSFDQWGVELGKVLAKNVKDVLVKNIDPSKEVNFEGFNSNSATRNLISKYRSFQKQ